MTNVIVHTDGGARGNPGPAALGVVIEIDGVKKNYGEAIGIATNNVAEYKAVIFAFKKLRQLLGEVKLKTANIKLCTDSELIGRQLRGEYKIKEAELQKMFLEAWNLKIDIPHLSIELIPREKNKEADLMVNQVLDAEKQKLF
ncbi:MAG TPA: ribonuclease HI family protein [Candidatus Paceibacterota bacterium]|nr:ribonuclease HI family protein [Candidatus Paceibacterota bacterium]